MREIKFRAWDKDYKKMITNFLLPESKSFGMHRMAISFTGEVFTFTDWNMAEYDEDGMYNSAKYPSRFKIMQYTGLKDKNGKEIYEGDIVCDRWANFYTPIFRNGIYMAYNVKDLHLTKQEPSTQFNVIWKNGCEVIGNIYENPDLLGEPNEN